MQKKQKQRDTIEYVIATTVYFGKIYSTFHNKIILLSCCIFHIKDFTHITRNIFIINDLFSILQLLRHSNVISSYNFLVFSQSSLIGSFSLPFWCSSTASWINRARGRLAQSHSDDLDATLTPDWPRAERMSSALANHANSFEGGWCLCESGGCAEWVAVPQPAAQRWTVLLWPLTAQAEVKIFLGWNEWLCLYFSLFQKCGSVGDGGGGNNNRTNQNFEVCSVYIYKHCAAVSQKAEHPRLSCVVFPVCVCVRARELIHKKQQN